MPRGAGHLPHRDRVPRRRRAARLGVAREDRHRHQHRPHGAARPARARHAGRRAPGPVDHPAARQPPRLRLELHGPGERRGRGLRGDAPGDELHRRHHLGAPARRSRRSPIPCRTEDDPGPAGGVHRELPDQGRARQVRARRHHPRQRAARRRVSVRAHHRPAARALAHGLDDAARLGARRDRAAGGGARCIRSTSMRIGAQARRRDHRGLAPRRDRAHRARRRRHAARHGLHPVRVLRGGGQPAHQRGARPVRQDRRGQVLRGEGDEGRRAEALASYGGGQSYREKVVR